MAKKGPKGGGREGLIDHRSQTYNSKTNLWVKRNTKTGRFMDDKTSGVNLKEQEGKNSKRGDKYEL